MNILMKHFGKAVEEWRFNNKYTQEEFANKSGLDVKIIKIVESGVGELNKEDKKKFALLIYSLLTEQ